MVESLIEWARLLWKYEEVRLLGATTGFLAFLVVAGWVMWNRDKWGL